MELRITGTYYKDVFLGTKNSVFIIKVLDEYLGMSKMWSLAMKTIFNIFRGCSQCFCPKGKIPRVSQLARKIKLDLFFRKKHIIHFLTSFLPLELMLLKAKQAALMKSCLPASLLEMIDANTWPGDGLMVYSDTGRPSSSEIAQNYCFLKPLIMNHPRKAVFLGQKC